MTLRTHHLLPVAVLGLLVLASCSGKKSYEINGRLDFPTEVPYGDTIISIPSPEGSLVYLLDGNEVLDSCEVLDNRFTFSGKVHPSDAHFAQVGNDFFQTLICIEPGEISVFCDGGLPAISGTPSNDGMYDTQVALSLFEEELREHFYALQDSLDAAGIELSEEHYMAFQEQFISRQNALLDSLYEANIDNHASIYAVILRHSEDGTADDFERALQDYPERVSKNPQVLELIQAMRETERAMRMKSAGDDSAIFGLTPEE